MMVTGGIKNGGKIGNLRDNNEYVLENNVDDFKDKILKNVPENGKNISQRYWKSFCIYKKIKGKCWFF